MCPRVRLSLALGSAVGAAPTMAPEGTRQRHGAVASPGPTSVFADSAGRRLLGVLAEHQDANDGMGSTSGKDTHEAQAAIRRHGRTVKAPDRPADEQALQVKMASRWASPSRELTVPIRVRRRIVRMARQELSQRAIANHAER